MTYILPIIVLVIFVFGYNDKFKLWDKLVALLVSNNQQSGVQSDLARIAFALGEFLWYNLFQTGFSFLG